MPLEHMAADLRELHRLCQECLAVVEREHEALAPGGSGSPGAADARKNILPELDLSLGKLRTHRAEWLRLDAETRAGNVDIALMLRRNMELIWKVISLDRENERLLLRMGRLPARHIPAAAASQPHFVSNLYRRNNTGT